MSHAQVSLANQALEDLRRQILRQLSHWEGAAERLDDFEATASPVAWAALERSTGVTLRAELKDAREQLKREALAVRSLFAAARLRTELDRVADQIIRLRDRYLQTELLVDFYVDAVRSRTNAELATQLRACDIMAERAIGDALSLLGRRAPPLITYFKPGIGASILRVGTSLWDGSLSRVAAIKITWHNRLRPTALVHEAGHQFAGITGWNSALAQAFRTGLRVPTIVAEQVAQWASEIAADSFAFAHTGYAAVAALSDVVAGHSTQVFRFLESDPHPISYLRVMLGVEMCRRFYGMGSWEELAAAWKAMHRLEDAPPLVDGVITAVLPVLPRIVDLALLTPLPCFDGRRLCDLVDPHRVAPDVLRQMHRTAGASAFNSSHWIWTECLRLTAFLGLRYAAEPAAGREILKQQEELMVRLGTMAAQRAA